MSRMLLGIFLFFLLILLVLGKGRANVEDSINGWYFRVLETIVFKWNFVRRFITNDYFEYNELFFFNYFLVTKTMFIFF